MSKFLPTGGFEWVDPKDIGSNKCSSNSSIGCVLEIYLEYTKQLSQLHNFYWCLTF